MNQQWARILAWLTAFLALVSAGVGVANATQVEPSDALHNGHLYAVGAGILAMAICVVHGVVLKVLGVHRDTPTELPVLWWVLAFLLIVLSVLALVVVAIGRMAWA